MNRFSLFALSSLFTLNSVNFPSPAFSNPLFEREGSGVSLSSPAGFGNARPLNDGWLFQLADDSAALAPDFVDNRWQLVSVPHDWSVRLPMSPDCGSCQGYLPGGIGWYRKHLNISADDLADGRRLYIFFEGVYNRSTVYVNGQLLGYRPSGFASFLYDLTPHLLVGEDNVIAVRVDHSRQNDSRWYTGSGIYRPVWLISAPATHFALWGTTWKIKQLNKKKAVVEVKIEDLDSPPSLPVRIQMEKSLQIVKVFAPSLTGRTGGESPFPFPAPTSGPLLTLIYIRFARACASMEVKWTVAKCHSDYVPSPSHPTKALPSMESG